VISEAKGKAAVMMHSQIDQDRGSLSVLLEVVTVETSFFAYVVLALFYVHFPSI
jgi:hypothetical protein